MEIVEANAPPNKELHVKTKDHFDKIVNACLDGLAFDGGHHKQYYLEQVLRLICEDSWVDEARDHFEWEKGITA